ncbi:hypothetical protein D3C81_1713950 [compost metagenome]
MAVFGQDRFRVELHTLDVKVLVAYAHDFAVIGPCGDFQAIRQRCALDCQRVITDHCIWRWQILEHADAGMRDLRSLAVHDLLRTHHLAAECRAYCLMSEADAEDRQLACKLLQDRNRHAGFMRRARTGRNADALRIQRGDLFQCDLVITYGVHVFAQFAEVLHQVVGERVVVIDHQ